MGSPPQPQTGGSLEPMTTTPQLANGQQYGQEDIQQQQPQQHQPAFYDEPQPLVYMGSQESGSGDGRLAVNQFSLTQDYSSSPSVSPSLITAKCWNNYENDNDCKQINVITASNANDYQQQHQHQNQQIDDDSIITPVVIFESSSTIEPAPDSAGQPPPAFLAPPYFSSSAPPEAGNVPLARHRTAPPPVPSANDVYAAPPAGATHLPPLGGPVLHTGHRWSPQDSDNQLVTRPTTSVFVATPAPKKLPKTSTVGRKCRDENDDDCDEPEEGEADEDEGGGDDDDDENETGTGGESPRNSVSESDKEDIEGDEEERSGGSRGPGGSGSSSTDTSRYGNEKSDDETGSGFSPMDDNDPTEDDDESRSPESSGISEAPNGERTTKYFEVEPQYGPHQQGGGGQPDQGTTEMGTKSDSGERSSSTMRSQSHKAEIEIVVHSTLPPAFVITSAETSNNRTGWPSVDWSSTPATDNNYPQITSTTIMPDDTITSKPVFPSTSPSSDLPDQAGGTSGNDATTLGAQASSPPTTEQDLATFKPVPMPPVEPEMGHRPADYRNLTDGNNGPKRDGDNPDNADKQYDDKHRFDPNAIIVSPPPPQKFDSPWREKPPLRSPGGQSSEPWASAGSRYTRPRAQDQQQQQGRDIGSNQGSTGNKGVGRVQADVLPTLLVYASIVIIVVTATIFSLVAFAFWRRNSARQRALLLHKTLNGGPGQHQMVGSMSQASQLVANMQQPGLLSTYGPGKGLALGKVTTSIIKSSEDSPIPEEDEGLVDNSPKDSLGEGSLNGATDNNGNNQRERQANSSWSTSEDQTTTTTTTTSGSQKTNESQQVIRGGGAALGVGPSSSLHQAPVPNARVHYPNSLSDDRQNSSSISGSQGSSIDNGPAMGPRKLAPPYSPPHQGNHVTNYNSLQHQQPYHANTYDDGVAGSGLPSHHQNYLPPHHVTGYYNPQAVIQDSVERYTNSSGRLMDNRQMDDQRYLTNEPTMQPPYMMAPNQMMSRHHQQQQLMKPLISNPNCPPAVAQRHIYQPPSPDSSYTSSTLPRQPMNQQGPTDAYLMNGMPHPRLDNGYNMHRNTISMEFSNQFDAHV